MLLRTPSKSPLRCRGTLVAVLRRRAGCLLALFSVAGCLSFDAHAASQGASVIALPNGVEVREGQATLRIVALRDDVLRVRESQTSALPEDASWAVLAAARSSKVPVIAEAHGFRTKKLEVTVTPELRITVSDLSGQILQQDATAARWDGTRFTVAKQQTVEDHFFGLGDKPGALDHAGQSYVLWNTDSFGWQESTDPIYKSIPFFIESRHGRTLGVLLNNTFRSYFDFGHQSTAQYSFSAENGPLDYFLLYGPEPKQVLSAYAWLTGATPLPPLWSLGFQQSRYTYSPEAKLLEIAQRLRTDEIPSDVLWLDIDFQKNNMPFTVDPQRFPNFPGMVAKLKQDSFHLVVIADLHVARQPGIGYAPYDSGTAGDHFVKLPDGSTYVGTVWPGPAVFPEFTRASSRAWWGTLYKQFVDDGVAGFWNDMNEPAIFGVASKTMPDDVQHRIDEPGFAKRTANHLEIHNVYGMLNSRGTAEGLLTLRPNERPFVMTRASFAGGQRYAVTWTGDNSATWNHLRMTMPQLINLGLSGFSMAGADVGGFASSPSPDLLTKWLEIAAFQPIDRDHSEGNTRPHEVWVDGPVHEAIRRHYIEQRYKLLPYLYTVAEQTSHDGVPMMRPLFVEFPHATRDGHPIDLDAHGSEFLLGPDLLVAPNPSPDEVGDYEVHLPPGTWYDYWTGERFERADLTESRDLEQRDAAHPAKPLMITPSLEVLPVFVRGGSIVPIAPLTQNTGETPQGPLTLRIYPASGTRTPCAGEVYTDDGHSFNYRSGEYARVRFSCAAREDGSLQLTIAPQQGRFTPWWTEYRLEVHGWSPKTMHATEGSTTAHVTQENASTWSVLTAADPAGKTITLHW